MNAKNQTCHVQSRKQIRIGKLRLFVIAVTIAGLFLSVLTSPSKAAPGDLDMFFGNSGKVTTILGKGGDGNAIAIQPDGKIVVAGTALTSNNNDFAVIRLNSDGSLDTSFDGDGKVITDFSQTQDYGYAVAIQSDGKIVVAGTSGSFLLGGTDFALVRYNTDGSLDTSFDGDGKLKTDFGTSIDYGYAVAIQTDGKIVVAGAPGFLLARYNTDGSLDTSFDGDGKVITAFGISATARTVVIQSNGKIVAAGSTFNGTNNDFALIRYNADGSLDTSFDGDGKVATNFGNSHDSVNAVAIQSDGRIIAVGESGMSSEYDFAVARYNTDGSPDASFDTDGKVTTNFGSRDLALAVAVQLNGKIVVAGVGPGFALARYNADGSLDISFDGDGKVTTAFSTNSGARAVAIQPDGKIVAAGYSNNGSEFNFAVARYIGDAVAPNQTLFDFDGDGRADISVFRPSNGAWYLNQSTNGFTGVQFGLSTDKIVPADFDGDGKTDIAVYRDGTWYLQRSRDGFLGLAFGAATDIPIPADFDGDGCAEIAVFRPSDGVWYIYNLTTNQFTGFPFGQAGDVPVAADYDGDGKTDVAVFRNGTWYIQQSRDGFTGIAFGQSGDIPVPTDYDGDGQADVAVFRPSDGTWYLQRSQFGFTGVAFGLGSDLPVPADYNGDGKTDVAVYRNGTWYIQSGTVGFTGVSFGEATDKPIPHAFVAFDPACHGCWDY